VSREESRQELIVNEDEGLHATCMLCCCCCCTVVKLQKARRRPQKV
jgi:hypothetical protein